MMEAQSLRQEIETLEDKLSEAKDDIVRAQRVERVKPQIASAKKAEVSKSLTEEMLSWAKNNSTLVYPVEVKIRNKNITLQDRAGQVQIPVKAGERVRVMQVHPASPDYLVVAQLNSDKLMATVPIKDSDFLEVLQVKYQGYSRSVGKKVSIPKSNSNGLAPLDFADSENETSSGEVDTVETDSNSPSVIEGSAINPQKSENALDSMPAKATAEKKVDTSGHGNNCVCKDCRIKKIGKGSLFPDL
jgi:hypothetical protein